jgi:glycosyltransferase involved in cell wall biosynthesis
MTMSADKKTRVLLVGQSPPPYNGMSVATELVKKALSGAVAVTHLDTADRRSLANVGRLDFRNVLLAFMHGAKCLWILLSKRPEVVYVPISQAWLPFLRDCLFLIPARILGRKVIIHLHGGRFGQFYSETSPVMRVIIRYAIGDVALAIVLGANVANAFDGILPRKRIRIVPNGIPDAFGNQGQVESKRVNEQTPMLLYLGTLAAAKGYLDLLRALPKVRSQIGAPIRVVLAGEWYSKHDKDVAHELVKNTDLDKTVQFFGPVGPEEKVDLLRGASVLVLPSENEGQPYVILEAMAAGVPVVSTHVACIPETVRDGIDGFLIEPHDVDALGERMSCLILNESLRGRMGRESRQRFLEHFTYERFAERMKAVFRESAQRSGDSVSMFLADQPLFEPVSRNK